MGGPQRFGETPQAKAIIALLAAAALIAGTVPFALQARAEGADTIRIEMQKAADGTLSGEATYYVENSATYYRELAKITEAAAEGYSLSEGSITITVAPVDAPLAAIESPDAVEGAAASGGRTWRVDGSAVSDEHCLALTVSAKAAELPAGETNVGTMTCDLTALEYTDMTVVLSAAPVVGEPLTAIVANAPSEATNAFEYAWMCSDDDGATWTPIEGATSQTFTPTADLAGKRITVQVACANPAWLVVNRADEGKMPVVERTDTYTVTFDANGFGTAPDPVVGIPYGGTVAKPADPAKSGYELVGCQRAHVHGAEGNVASPVEHDERRHRALRLARGGNRLGRQDDERLVRRGWRIMGGETASCGQV